MTAVFDSTFLTHVNCSWVVSISLRISDVQATAKTIPGSGYRQTLSSTETGVN